MYHGSKIIRFAYALTFLHLACALPSFSQNIEVVGSNGSEVVDGDAADIFKLTEFPNTAVGQTEGRTFAIRNTQSPNDLVLSLPITVTGSNPGDFVVVQPIATIPSFSGVLMGINFTPSAAGVRTAIITINSNDPDSESVYTFAVKGTGYTGLQLARPDLGVDFKKLPKGKFNKKLGTTFVRGSIEIQNKGFLNMESGLATIYVSFTENFDAATDALVSLPFGPLPAAEPGKKPKSKKLKFKVDAGNHSSGKIFVRVFPQLPSDVDKDYVDNQVGASFEIDK